MIRNTRARRTLLPLLTAALLLAALVAGVALGSGLLRLPLLADASATPDPGSPGVAVASPSTDPSPSENAPSDVPSDHSDPANLARRTLFAEADGVRLRTEPTSEAEVVATLRRGQLVGATGNRVSADGMDWYEVGIGPGGLAGWVAAGPGGAWLRLVDDGAVAFQCDGCGVGSALVSVTPFGDSALTTLATEAPQDFHWSPDGTKLVLTVSGEMGSAVEVMDVDGSDRRVIGPGGYGPAWSPDGSRLAWSIGSTLVVTDASRTPVEMDLGLRSAGNPLWSPDGSRLAFGAVHCPECPPDEPIFGDPPTAVYTVAVDGTDLSLLTAGNYDGVSAWSADGTQLAGLRHDLSGEFPTRAFSLPAEGGAQTFLLDGAAVASEPAWSPDGTRLAIATPTGLVILNGDGSDARIVATDSETGIRGVEWAPSGRSLLYATGGSSARTGLDLWIVAVDGTSAPTRVSPENAAAQMPAWQPLLLPMP